ncbi:MAG: ATP:cob(I)alamin adenosyltransferase, partial [Saprospiraceae bacterium]|nr:ATP:cob(I)alamin adenosyltransferase [Saprospiraceae bacterium]
MKIYTKTGDKGLTSLWGGQRVSKDEIQIEAYGTIDELNSHLGLVRDQNPVPDQDGVLLDIQRQLFSIGSLLATAPQATANILPPTPQAIRTLEDAIDHMNTYLPVLR